VTVDHRNNTRGDIMHRSKLCCSALAVALSLLNADVSVAAAPGITVDPHLVSGRPIDATSLQWGVTKRELGTTGRFANAFNDVSWTQNLDGTVPSLWANLLAGPEVEAAQYDLVAPGRTDGRPYLSLTTGDNLVSSLSIVGDQVDVASNYRRFALTYDPRGLGRSGPTRTTGFNLETDEAEGPKSSVATLFTGTQPAAVPGGETSIYLRVGNGLTSIAGESKAAGYENWIKLDSVQMGASTTFSGSGRSTPMTSVDDLAWTQAVDASVPVMLANLLYGTIIPMATIEFVKDAGAGPLTFMQLVLDEVQLKEVSLSASDESIANVKGSLNYTGFRQTVWSILPGGLRGQATSIGYDVSLDVVTDGPLPPTMADFGRGNLAPVISGGGSVPTQPIPEPSTWVLMLGGVAMLAGVARRQARRP